MRVTARSFETVLQDLKRRSSRAARPRPSPPLANLRAYWAILDRAGACSFTDDFVLVDPKDAARIVAGGSYPAADLGEAWWPFARSRGGDLWLAALPAAEDGEVAFLDHDQETKAVPDRLGLNLAQWAQWADLMRQVEALMDADPTLVTADFRLKRAARSKVVAELNTISPGLADRSPFRL